MSVIRVDLNSPVQNGQSLTFKSPLDCSKVTGLRVYYPEDLSIVYREFVFADAHKNIVNGISLFADNVLVKVILDTDLNRAYVQNADTNAYLEAKFNTKAPASMLNGTVIIRTEDELTEFLEREAYESIENCNKTFIVSVLVDGLSLPKDIWRLDVLIHNECASYRATGTYYCENVTVHRNFDGRELTPWEYENPPMKLGVEYLTTEKFSGRYVYTKLLKIDLTEATIQTVNIDDISPIRISSFSVDDTDRVVITSSGTGASVNSGELICTRSATNVTQMYVQIWYINTSKLFL